MTLVDTSIWVDHLRSGYEPMARMLASGGVLMHPFVVGELSLGYLNPRAEILEELRALPKAIIATDEEVVNLVGQQQLFGSGVSYIDVHLLASTRLSAGSRLWTRDRKLLEAARDMRIAYEA